MNLFNYNEFFGGEIVLLRTYKLGLHLFYILAVCDARVNSQLEKKRILSIDTNKKVLGAEITSYI